MNKGRKFRDQRLSARRCTGTFDDFAVLHGLAVQRLVAGIVWFQRHATRSKPANAPLVWAKKRIFEFGSPCADFPFPQAAEASEPIVNRSESSFERRSLSSDRITMSIVSPPI